MLLNDPDVKPGKLKLMGSLFDVIIEQDKDFCEFEGLEYVNRKEFFMKVGL